MEEQVNQLADKVWEKYLGTPSDRRYMISIGGIPGSGKTTLSQTLAAAINRRHACKDPSVSPIAIAVPMDGFHLTRAQLSAMPDPAHAHARRGAEFTFDGAAFLALVHALRLPLTSSSEAVLAPAFDHATKDPVAGGVAVTPSHRVVLFEGNYVVLDRQPWREAAELVDERWFVDADFAVARRRLVRRHLAAGIAATAEEADRRAVENDLVNGEEIVLLRLPVDEVVVSREDDEWAPG